LRLKRCGALAVLLLAAALIAGCGAEDSRAGKNSYGDDGYLGLTNAHPGILTSPRARTYAADSRMMEKAISGIEGVERSRIIFNGGRVFVRLKLREGLGEAEREAIRLRAEDILRKTAPRYTVKVGIDP